MSESVKTGRRSNMRGNCRHQFWSKTAYKGLKAFVGVPAEYADAELTSVPEVEYKNIKKGIELGEISKLLGATFQTSRV